jgi:hypothetical protein
MRAPSTPHDDNVITVLHVPTPDAWEQYEPILRLIETVRQDAYDAGYEDAWKAASLSE